MHVIKCAMILAAGRGERMRELTATRPKPLLEIAGRSLIERQIERLVAAGLDDVVVNLAYGGDAIRAALGDGSRWGVRIHYSQEGAVALETGGGIIEALPLLGTAPFIVINADVLTDFPLTALTDARDQASTLVLVENPPHHPTGDFALDADGWLVAQGPRLTYAGIARLEPALFAGWSPGRQPLRPILEAAIAARRLRGIFHRGQWLDVGTPERWEEAQRIAAAATSGSAGPGSAGGTNELSRR